ncbi:MAG: hypothetical protein KHY46_00720 [Clostridiales bacterium]|nr:hypothetical protein [Clostridiales bacterium]
MLELKDFMPIQFLKKEKFTGSHQGMRFRMEKTDLEEGTKLLVTIWPEPYGYDATPEEERTSLLLSFDADGIAKGVDWINEQFEQQQARWRAVSRR